MNGGILGLNDEDSNIDEGTLQLSQSPKPGPIGLSSSKVTQISNDQLSCLEMLNVIKGGIIALPKGGRLDKALKSSGLDIETMLAQAYKESSWRPNAKAPNSSATGLWQILKGTADDIQDRVWPKFVSNDNPLVPEGERLVNYRADRSISTSMYYVYLLDRIASAGGALRKGLERYFGGPGKEDYARKVLAGRRKIKSICGSAKIEQCMKLNCQEIKRALETVVR